MPKREDFIAGLTQDLAPVKRIPNLNILASSWFLISVLYVVIVVQLYAPIRPNALSQLTTYPRFLMEMVLGLVAIYWLAKQAFRDAVPGAFNSRMMTIGLVLIALWISQYVIGLVYPAIEPSSLGKRGTCSYETMIFSLPPMIGAWFYIRKCYPLNSVRTSMMISLASGMIPAWFMQIACMYESSHILTFHIAPGVAMALIGSMILTKWKANL